MESRKIQWLQFAIGLWIFISPWLLGFSDIVIAKWSNIIVGLVLIVVSIWNIFENVEGERSEQPKKSKH